MEASLIYSHSKLISPCQQLLFILVIPQGDRILELFKFEAKRFSEFFPFVLFSE